MLTAQDKAQQPKRTPEEQFKRMDANNDGKLTVQEFVGKREGEKAEKAKDQFKRLDKNNDGAVTLEEFLAGQKKK
jgi:Ca2+-binding EF-hand superfamily protein